MTGVRSGFAVVEALLALVLGLLLLALSTRALASGRSALEGMRRQSEELASVRMTREVLGREARHGGVGSVSRDTLAVRAFRGIAFVCPTRADSARLVVRAEGVRRAAPEKDSVAFLLPSGDWVVRGLAAVDRAEDACAGAGRPGNERWALTGAVPPGAVLARWFEPGSYHLSGGALRYRRGRAGRQPLTPTVLRTPESRFVPTEGSLEAVLEMDGGGPPWRVGLGPGA